LREPERLAGLIGGAVVYYRPGFLSRPQADQYFEAFVPGGAAAVPWARRTFTMFGRECLEGHDTASYGDPGASYRYSGRADSPALVMAGPTQQAYKHYVEAEKMRVAEEGPELRVNLTFRCVRVG